MRNPRELDEPSRALFSALSNGSSVRQTSGRQGNPRLPLQVYNNRCKNLTNALYNLPVNQLYTYCYSRILS
jgi:hypothetical protein